MAIDSSVSLQNVNLTEVGGSAIALGQTTMAASLPVAIASNQSAIPVSGTVTANAGTGNFTVVQPTGSNLHVDVDNFPATTAVTQSTSPWVVSLTSTTITGTVAVTQSTSPWVDNLTQVGGSAISLGQKTSVNSIPVVIASDQSPINVALAGETPVLTYATDAAVASGSSTTHSLAGPVTLDKIDFTASGELKATVAIGITGSEVTYWNGFNSASHQDIEFALPYGYVIPTGSSVKVTLKNRDTAAQDLYVTFFSH